MKVYLDTSPLNSGHAVRGIGMYTKQLQAALSRESAVELVESAKIADVVHYPFFDFFQATLPLKFSQNTVVTIHDVIPLEFPEYYKPGIKGSLCFKKQKLALPLVKAIITDSEYSKQKIEQLLQVPKSKINVTYLAANPVLQPQTASAIKRVRTEYNLPPQYVLYVGDINYNKNIPQLIKALKYLPEDIKLVCLGKNFFEQPIPEWQWIEAQLEMSEVSQRVQFLTTVSPEKMEVLAAIYAGAVCYVQPSLSEGFGLPVIEALQCGCPVVSSNRGSLPEVGGAVPIYVEPTAQDIAKGVEQVLELPKSQRTALSEKGSNWAKNFSWSKTAKQTVEVYKQVIK